MKHSGYLFFLTGIVLFLLAGCGDRTPPYVSDTHFALGTVNTVKIQSFHGKELIKESFAVLDDVEARMSRNLPDSEVSRINESAGISPVKVSEQTFHVIEKGLEISALGNGYFDITIGPVVSLWGIGTDSARVPSPSEIKAALDLVDYRDVILDKDASTVFLRKKGMSIDLGAIAKGWAADRIHALMVSKGVERGILNLGGNVFVIGRKSEESKWRVGIQNPEDTRGRYLGIIKVCDSAVVTSGKYERFFMSGGHRYHHIFNTFTGYPVENGIISVTIVAKESLVADAYSTLVFSLGLDKGMAIVEETPFLDAVIITASHDVYVSGGLENIFSLTDNNYRMAE